MSDLSQEEWTDQLKNDANACILDVRTPKEVEKGYIPGATHIDFYLGHGFLEALEKLDKTKNYYVYCRSGSRSSQTCTLMNRIGIAHTYNLKGGFVEWNGEIAK